MAEKTFTITDETGIHARPATALVNEASKYQSDVKLAFNGKEVNLKSIMGVMSLGIQQGSEVTVTADGEDADAALSGVADVMKKEGLGE
ncbi:phosphocarrier protein HPr [Bacillus marinisedimentorum]|uniref:phosphocarrier protein HPr n=1 Tax=Bacillus marinisedimentorum TaxID=1821260 RepID=UPI000871DAB2|nr:phosphocarrier protein HPr [Bacillus marinisedimentorum]